MSPETSLGCRPIWGQGLTLTLLLSGRPRHGTSGGGETPTLRAPRAGTQLSSSDSRRSLPVAGTDRQTHRTEGPVALPSSLWPQTQFSIFLLFSPLDPPKPCNLSLPLGAGGDSRSALGTIRGLGGASVAGPRGGRGGIEARVRGKKTWGNSGTVSCWGAED